MKIRLIIGFMVAAFFLTAPAGLCADEGFNSDGEFWEWVTYYYRDPAPEKIPAAITYFSGSPLYQSNANMPMVAFFSALFRKDPSLTRNAFNEISAKGSENAKIMMVNALSLTNDPVGRAMLGEAKNVWRSKQLEEIIERQLSLPPVDLYGIDVNSPLVLDMLWASFFATGDDLPVQRVISVLHLVKDGQGDEIVVGGGAQWSLQSNAKQHPRVLEICKAEWGRAQGVTKVLLEEIINQNQ